MKLYSGKQLFLTILATFVITFIFFSFFLFSKDDNDSDVNQPVKLNELGASILSDSTDSAMTISRSNSMISDEENNNISIYTTLNSAVVNITTEVLTYNWFLEPVPKAGGSGSGSIIDSSGIILTNTHVVENAYKVYVILSDGSQYTGKVIGKDTENDLAVVQIEPEGKVLNTIPLGKSSSLQIGQKVLAIGNPFGYDRTLTTGIVSGLARPVRSTKNLIIQNMIQTDASINPGNSGGPLINSDGEMIGINAMIFSPSGGSVGIGFAVPVDTARRVIPDLIKFGEVKRGWIDVTPIQLNQRIAQYAGLSIQKGILISKVKSNGLAEKAGLQGGTEPVRYGRSIIYLGGDVIVEIDNQGVSSYTDLFSALEDNKPGDLVKIKYYRNNKEFTTEIELIDRPENLLQES